MYWENNKLRAYLKYREIIIKLTAYSTYNCKCCGIYNKECKGFSLIRLVENYKPLVFYKQNHKNHLS